MKKTNKAVIESKTERLVLAHNKEINDAREAHPEMSLEIDKFRQQLREDINSLKKEVQKIEEEHDKELYKVYIINEIHKMTDEIFFLLL